jgi:bacteriorhodopsin
MDSLTASLHWAYVAVMFASALVFYGMSRQPQDVPQYKYVIHIFVVVWSGLAYMAIALGQGTLEVDGRTVYFARYVDWVVSTPLLLLSLNLTGKLLRDVEGPITAGLLGSQAIMILTGLVADLSPADRQWYWYVAGCVALVVVLALMWGELQEKARSQGPLIADVYRKSALFLTIQWLAYPLIWLIGTPGLGYIDALGTTVFFLILPIVSKTGFALYNLSLLRQVAPKLEQKPA